MSTETAAAVGVLPAATNAHIAAGCDGLLLRGDVVAVYQRSRKRNDGQEFKTVEVHIATAAKVMQIEFWDERLVKEITGLGSLELAGAHLVVPVRCELFVPRNDEGIITGTPRNYWKARRLDEPGEGA